MKTHLRLCISIGIIFILQSIFITPIYGCGDLSSSGNDNTPTSGVTLYFVVTNFYTQKEVKGIDISNENKDETKTEFGLTTDEFGKANTKIDKAGTYTIDFWPVGESEDYIKKTITVKITDDDIKNSKEITKNVALDCKLPELSNKPSAKDITFNSATLNAEIIDFSGTKSFIVGFVWAETNQTPTLETGNKAPLAEKQLKGEFSTTITSLAANKTYYIWAYAEKYGYGIFSKEAVSITTTTIPIPEEAIAISDYSINDDKVTINGVITALPVGNTIAEYVFAYDDQNGNKKTVYSSTDIPAKYPHSFSGEVNKSDVDGKNVYAYLKVGDTPLYSAGKKVEKPYVTDFDGNRYEAVEIGTQLWMAENLKTKHYADGTEIKEGVWAYDNDEANKEKYGLLYTFNAATRNADDKGGTVKVQGVCPEGWHVPSENEWTALENFIMESGIPKNEAGKALKSTTGWYNNGNGTDNFGFNALPGGYRDANDGSFDNAGKDGGWWSSTPGGSENAWGRFPGYGRGGVGRGTNYRTYGYSVRCLKD